MRSGRRSTTDAASWSCSFASLFEGNSLKNGLIVVTLLEHDIAILLQPVAEAPGYRWRSICTPTR